MKNEKLMLSVVLCAYNAERYISETIESVLVQSFSDFEFIIWNDGSTDSTEDIIKKYNDKRIVYYKDKNRGFGPASKIACTKAHGKYIARIDSDDVCMPNRFKRQIDYLESHPNYILCCTDFFYFNENSEILGRAFCYTSNFIIKKLLSSHKGVLAHPSSMFRREVYEKVGGYSNSKNFQDLILWNKMMVYGKIKVIPVPLIKYRLLVNSLSHKTQVGPYVSVISAMRDKIIDDGGQISDDLDIYNQIVRLNDVANGTLPTMTYQKSVEERIYLTLSHVMGKALSSKIVHGIKNIYGFIMTITN